MNIKLGGLFPFHMRILGYVLLFGAFVVIIANPWASLALGLFGILLAFSYHGVEFRKDNQKFREYNSFFFLKFGEWEPFAPFEKIFINPVKSSQYIYTKVNTGSTIRENLYASYLKISESEKIPLKRSKNKEKLIDELRAYADFLEIPIQDNSKMNRD